MMATELYVANLMLTERFLKLVVTYHANGQVNEVLRECKALFSLYSVFTLSL